MKLVKTLLFSLSFIFLLSVIYLCYYWNLIPSAYYTSADFQVIEYFSDTDYDCDGIDDAHDFLYGARTYTESGLKYKSSYYTGGYPDDEYSVCTDVIWNAFSSAGYSLKDLIDQDIQFNSHLYQINYPDPNIDFRRVRNLKVFFERFAQPLTLDILQIDQWQPGDIVVFAPSHIGIISDKRNSNGIPYLIHHGGQPNKEEDCILKREMIITGHYRWR